MECDDYIVALLALFKSLAHCIQLPQGRREYSSNGPLVLGFIDLLYMDSNESEKPHYLWGGVGGFSTRVGMLIFQSPIHKTVPTKRRAFQILHSPYVGEGQNWKERGGDIAHTLTNCRNARFAGN